MTPTDLTALRALIGTPAIERLTGLDRRTIKRAAEGATALYPETEARLRQGLTEAAQLAGEAAGVGAIGVVEQVAAALPASGQIAIRSALHLWREGRPLTQAELCQHLGRDTSRGAIRTALHRLEAVGLVKIVRPAEGYGITAEWIA